MSVVGKLQLIYISHLFIYKCFVCIYILPKCIACGVRSGRAGVARFPRIRKARRKTAGNPRDRLDATRRDARAEVGTYLHTIRLADRLTCSPLFLRAHVNVEATRTRTRSLALYCVLFSPSNRSKFFSLGVFRKSSLCFPR